MFCSFLTARALTSSVYRLRERIDTCDTECVTSVSVPVPRLELGKSVSSSRPELSLCCQMYEYTTDR